MLIHSRNAFLCLGVAASTLWAGAARAQSPTPVPLALPSLTFNLLSTPVPTAGVSLYQAVLTGYVFSPTALSALTQSQINAFSIASFQEKSYELQPGASVLSVQGTTAAVPGVSPGDTDWVLSGDARIAAPLISAIPEDPLPPSDPFTLTFLFTVTNPSGAGGVPISKVPFYYTTVSGLPTGQLLPFVAVPEPSSLALLGLGLVGVVVTATRRRRA